jgi:hypothetical protein
MDLVGIPAFVSNVLVLFASRKISEEGSANFESKLDVGFQSRKFKSEN